ncbi:MAG: peptidase [Proteobacteria bacterium]|nr:peptidase [Pseudomonadota bacterium]
MRSISIPAIGLLLLSACGGGGGGGGGNNFKPVGWTSGVFQPESTFANKCAVPRTGTDPFTNMAYPDKAGTTLDENNFLRSWTNDLYLWFDEVTDQNPAGFSTTAAYFDVLKTMATTSSGAAKDKFHFTYKTSDWEALSQSGVQAGYGAQWVLLSATPPRQVVVAFTEPNSPATTAPANLARGAQVLQVDGVDLVNDNTQAGVDTLNAGLFPATLNETHTFVVQDLGASTTRTITLTSASITTQPVQDVTTIPTAGGGTVGYMLFNDHLATSEAELVNAFTTLQAAGVTDLVLDIRYNGGGYLDIASEVAYMIAGPGPTAGMTFELTQFNSKHPTIDPVAGGTITPTPFYSTTQGFSTTAGQALPALNLPRVFVLTGKDTCSASESIINSLNGVGVQVVQIGSTTCGKPYGFYPQDNCGTTYFSIEFRGVNAMNFGDYTDGFSPQNAPTPTNAVLPGCSVGDDFGHALGDPAEARLAAALNYIATPGTCPTPASGFAKSLGVEQAATIGGIPLTVPSSRALRILGHPRR